MNGQPAYQPFTKPEINPWDHTSEYSAQDISQNKIFAMCSYVFSLPGMIIALLAAKDSAYSMFHLRQCLKLDILNILLGVVTAALAFTVIVPILSGILIFILAIVRIIAFVDVCKGKATDVWLIRSLKFMN